MSRMPGRSPVRPAEAHDALNAQLDRVRADLSERIETLVATRSRIDEFLAARTAETMA